MTISTVGYGDISPSPNVGIRIFTVLYILVGSGYAFSKLAKLFDGALVAFTTCVKSRIGIGGTALDLDGDGTADFIQPPSAFTFWAQELLPAFLLLMRCLRVQKRSRAHARPIHLRKVSISALLPG